MFFEAVLKLGRRGRGGASCRLLMGKTVSLPCLRNGALDAVLKLGRGDCLAPFAITLVSLVSFCGLRGNEPWTVEYQKLISIVSFRNIIFRSSGPGTLIIGFSSNFCRICYRNFTKW